MFGQIDEHHWLLSNRYNLLAFTGCFSREARCKLYIYKFIDQAIQAAGPENVIQIVTDNASNNTAATNIFSLKMPNIF